jgi:pyridinium-3,5-bisthiocarboxylic acid mononucleotide nickel chelatase
MDLEHSDSSMLMIEANLDDMPGEWMGYVLEGLFKQGAKDAFYTPIIMKKNRPAYKLSVLLAGNQLEQVKAFLFAETTTLGLRYFPVTCHRLEREFFRVELSGLGTVMVKIGRHKGEIVQLAPEYEDCAKLAKQNGLPLKHIYEEAKNAARNQYPNLFL